MSHPLTDALPSYMDALALRQACGEIEAQLRAEADCRTCRQCLLATGECVSVVRCIDGSGYQRLRPVQFWTDWAMSAALEATK
jgi:hypothetical protein